MKRRELLRDLFLAGGAFAVAGCLGGEGGENGSSPDGTDTTRTDNGKPTTAGPAPTIGPATTDPKTSPTDEPRATSTTSATETTGEPIPIPDAPAGGEKNTSVGGTARVTFRGNGSHIVVRGTIVGQDGCRTAVLESVRQESKSGLVVMVATERTTTTGRVCTMALVDIDYQFTIRRDSPPASVTVVHRGATGERTVTTATP
jgi:hypothetical protein